MLFLYQKLMALFVCRKNGHFFLINDISGRDATGRVHWNCSVCGKPHVGENGKTILEASGGRCDIDPKKVDPLIIALKGGLGEKIWCQILDLFYGSSVHLDISQMFPGDDYLSKAMREPYSEEFSEFVKEKNKVLKQCMDDAIDKTLKEIGQEERSKARANARLRFRDGSGFGGTGQIMMFSSNKDLDSLKSNVGRMVAFDEWEEERDDEDE